MSDTSSTCSSPLSFFSDDDYWDIENCFCGLGSDQHKRRVEGWHQAKFAAEMGEATSVSDTRFVLWLSEYDKQNSLVESCAVDVDGATTLFQLVQYLAEVQQVRVCQIHLLWHRNGPVDDVMLDTNYRKDMSDLDAFPNDTIGYRID